MRRHLHVLVWLIGMTAWVSCNNIPDCDEPNTFEVIVQFRDSTNTESEEVIFDRISDLNSDVVFIEQDTLSQVELEINQSDTIMSYLFEAIDGVDTLTISYRQNILLRSEECGPVQRFIDLEIRSHSFADTLLVNNELLRNEVNIQIIR